MKTSLRDKPTWLFDLVHGDMEPDTIAKGFIKFYVLQDRSMSDVMNDVYYHPDGDSDRAAEATRELRESLEFLTREVQTRDAAGRRSRHWRKRSVLKPQVWSQKTGWY